MQNTVVKAFAGEPRVVTAIMSQAESREVLEEFWRNVYLRGPMIFDPTGAIAKVQYGQPSTGLPFGRDFVIGPDQTIVLPTFGHDPDLIIATIRELLRDIPRLGDLNCDNAVNFADINPFVLAISDPDEYRKQYPDCDIRNADINKDGKIDFGDIEPFVRLLGGDGRDGASPSA